MLRMEQHPYAKNYYASMAVASVEPFVTTSKAHR